MDHLCGAVISPQFTDEVCEALSQHGPVSFADARPGFKGFGEGKSYLHQEAEQALFGKTLPSWMQNRGTCFPAGSMVLMADGTEKMIEMVGVGDEVISHTGKPRRVLATGSRKYTGLLHSIKSAGCIKPAVMTSEHPVAVYPEFRKKLTGQLVWTSAESLSAGQFVLHPTPRIKCAEKEIDLALMLPPEDQVVRIFKDVVVGSDYVRPKHCSGRTKRFVRVDERLARLIGLYAAEGNTELRGSRPCRTTWTFGAGEMEFAEFVRDSVKDIFGVTSTIIDQSEERRTIRVRANSRIVSEFFSRVIPGKAITKRISDFIFSLPVTCRSAFFRGWMDGDGHWKVRQRLSERHIPSAIANGITSSSVLADGLYRISCSLGHAPNAHLRKMASHQNAASTSINWFGEEACRVIPELAHQWSRGTITKSGPKHKRVGFGILRRIKEISTLHVENVTVYNLEVEEDHSYVVSGLAVHNCVSQGSGRAIQDAIYSSIAVGGLVGDLVSICFETIYGGSRVQIGRGQLGGGDGSCGAWAAQFMHDFGILKRGTYGSINLESPREDLAVQWGQPRYGVPQSLLAESASHKLVSCMQCHTVEDVRDALAARYGVARCADRATDGVRDKDGIRRPRASGGHCQEICGVYVDKNGNLMFVEQQSWGNAGPKGGGTFKLQDGREIAPREGSCAICPDDVEYYLRNGEVWAFAPPRELWQTEHVKPSDM